MFFFESEKRQKLHPEFEIKLLIHEHTRTRGRVHRHD